MNIEKSVKTGKRIIKERIEYFEGEIEDVDVALEHVETDAQFVALEAVKMMYKENIKTLKNLLKGAVLETEEEPKPIRFVKTEDGAELEIDGDILIDVLEKLFGDTDA